MRAATRCPCPERSISTEHGFSSVVTWIDHWRPLTTTAQNPGHTYVAVRDWTGSKKGRLPMMLDDAAVWIVFEVRT
jgi:hypothetical protein